MSDTNNKYKLYLYKAIIYNVIILFLFRKLFSLQLYILLNIRSELGLTDTHKGGSVTNCFSGVPLNTFMDATEAEILNIIKLSPVKSCELDPLTTWLLKECKAELVPLITDIVNMSLRESMFPKSLKTALIRPLLKKTGLDSDILKNYRPVSNLTFISKVIEKVISGRLNEHLINNSLFDPLQSAYRDKHSTETALIKVQNDILSALDVGSSAILLMLDLSAAFDTIDHDILLSRLCNVYGITGDALDWFRSYLSGRIQRVVIEDSVSVDQELAFVEFHRVLCWVREFIACTPNLLVISFSGMDCLTIPMQMTRSCI